MNGYERRKLKARRQPSPPVVAVQTQKVHLWMTEGILRHADVGVAAAKYVTGEQHLQRQEFLRRSVVLVAEFWIEEAKKLARERGVEGPRGNDPRLPLEWGDRIQRFLERP